jgi:hypothetical protein
MNNKTVKKKNKKTNLSLQLWRKAENKRIVVQPSLGKKQDPVFKISRVKKDKIVAQALEFLPSKCKALSSNSSTPPHTHIYITCIYI